MPASGKTTNYQIPIYNPGDTANYLTSYNQGMTLIDAQMKANATAAEQAQDGVNNLESEYETVVQTLSTHTTQIGNNEKAIAANTASIEELGNQVNEIEIFDVAVFTVLSNEVTKVETLVNKFAIKGRRVGSNFSGICGIIMKAGTLHNYDRQADIGTESNMFITDLIRITGNPFNLKNNYWEWLVGGSNASGGTFGVAYRYCIAYLPESGYTIVGVGNSDSTPVEVNASLDVIG